jgi:hypothetical protein
LTEEREEGELVECGEVGWEEVESEGVRRIRCSTEEFI